MDVLVAADMEGVAGIEDYGDCLPSHPRRYARGRRLLTEEVLVAVEALQDGGAGRISVGDWHMVGTNVEREWMPDGVEVRPIADLALNEAEPSMSKAHGGPLDAVVMIGHHARTPSPRGFCSHTFIWGMEVLLGGEQLSEVQTYAQALAEEEVPILVASGDRWLLEETDEGELGSARKVVTKEGQGRGRARSVDPAAAHAELREAIAAAMAGPLQPPPARTYPAELIVRVEGEEIARTTVAKPADLLTEIATVFRTSQVSREYRQLAKLLPPDNSLLRSTQRHLGSLLATPVMRSKERAWLAAGSPGLSS
ncbi:MAG TPA: M55 family metallopeptidase [Solirubrobacterales bacterium]|nr:M55 family metallopeptidase [Solirubrobacterales bacterium]